MKMKFFFVNILLFSRGLTSPITTSNPNEGSTDMNIKQSPVTAPASSSLVSSKDLNEGMSGYTTPTMYEIVEQELETELEMTTTSSNPTETTMPFTNPSPNQEEVLNELQDLWYYSEGLSDSQNELKSSISSIVHLAYIRVQTEPEETLDRLKYMLQKLKARLLIGEESSATTTSTSHQDFDNQNTEIIFADDSTTESSPSPTTAETPQMNETRIHKRSALIGKGEYENVFLSDNSAENSLFPILQTNKDKNYNKDKINSNIESHTPTEATIQKIIHVKDRAPIPHKMNSTIKLPQIHVHTLDFTNSSSHTKNQSISSTTEIPSIIDTIMTFDKKPTDTATNSQDDENENSITADQIANAIFLLLNTGPKNASSSTQNLTVKKPIYIHDSDMPPVNNDNNNDQVHPLGQENNQTELDSLHSITTLRPLPDYLNKFHLGLLSQEIPKPIDKKTTIVISEKLPIDNSLSEEIMSSNTNAPEILPPTVPTKPQSPIVHIMAEISESNLMLSPTTILNGTKEGIVQFVQTFNTLSFAAKMALLFVLSVSILSIALGIYSMGPPIIAVGVLGIVIPITLLILLQANIGKKRSKGKKEGMHIETAIQEFANEEFNQIIDLIFDAINKYS